MVDFAREEHGLSERSACRAVRLSGTVYHYKPDTRRDETVIEVLQELADQYPRYGFGKMFPILRRRGYRWNHKRVYRVYCSLGLNMRRKVKRRVPSRHPEPLHVPVDINKCWSADFMSDSLWSGRKFRTFNLLDDFNRELLGIEEVLSAYVFKSLSEVRRITENWLIEYNEQRPRESLGDLTPTEYLASVKPLDTSI